MNFHVRIKPKYYGRFTNLRQNELEATFEVLVCSEHNTYIVWLNGDPDRKPFVVNRWEVDIVL